MDVISVKSHMLAIFESFFIAYCLVSLLSLLYRTKAFNVCVILCENKQTKKVEDNSKVCRK